MITVHVLDLTNPPEKGVIVYNSELDPESVSRGLTGLPPGLTWMIPVDDVNNAIAVLDEEDLKKAGWVRIEKP